MNSAYYIQRKGQSLLQGPAFSHPVLFERHRGNHIVTHTSPVYTTAKANRRQLIADKGSFDGGASCCAIRPGSAPRSGITFRAALTERQINVDRVSIRKGAAWKVDTQVLAPVETRGGSQLEKRSPERLGAVSHLARKGQRWKSLSRSNARPPFTNADSYSQCFRQLDCKTDCFEGGAKVVDDTAQLHVLGERSRWYQVLRCLHSQQSVGRFLMILNLSPATTFKAVCGTQTKQGGCLYERPVVRIVLQVSLIYQARAGLPHRTEVPQVWVILNKRGQDNWQKPGIGARPSVRSSSLKALPRGKDSPVLSGMMPRALVLQAGKDTYRGKGRSYGDK